jgi:hypothetical protein
VPFGEINSNELTEFTVADGTWRALGRLNDGEPAPMRRFGQAMVCDGHAIWVVGGTDGHEFYADVWKFDLEMLSWEWCHPGVVGDDDPFVPQGRCETTPTPFEIRPCRHSSSGSTPDTPAAISRYRHETVLYGTDILVIGGGW